MDYSLYSRKGKKLAEKEADGIVSNFLSQMIDWQAKYSSLGAQDTASREAFAVNVAESLGLDVWGNR